MKLIVGLGNPGKEYERTRHNAGYMFIDSFKKEMSNSDIKNEKTTVFMNNSGSYVKKQVEYYKLLNENLFIVHDDLDIALGEYKIQFGIGPKVHNGINDIEENLNTKNFWRIRIGVDNREQGNRIPGEAYVLQNFNKQELELLNSTISKIIKDLSQQLQ